MASDPYPTPSESHRRSVLPLLVGLEPPSLFIPRGSRSVGHPHRRPLVGLSDRTCRSEKSDETFTVSTSSWVHQKCVDVERPGPTSTLVATYPFVEGQRESRSPHVTPPVDERRLSEDRGFFGTLLRDGIPL